MSSKPTPSDPSLEVADLSGQLSQMAQVVVEGPEALVFLQRQCTSDLRLLAEDGSMQWSALLSAKGRVLHLFRLLRLAADRFLLLAADNEAGQLALALQRFVLRSKLKVTPLPSSPHAAIGVRPPAGDHWLAWDHARWISAEPAAAPGANEIDRAWQHLDTVRGIPRIGADLGDRFTPQMLSLQSLHAFSLSKGCYPGQEIVARTHYLGQQKREMMRIEAERPLQRGESVSTDGRSLGEVIQVSRRQPALGLAVLSREQGEAGLTLSDGVRLQAHRIGVD